MGVTTGAGTAESESVRLFTAAEANALLPRIEALLREMDDRVARARELSDLVSDLEGYWGPALMTEDNPDREDHRACLRELETVRAQLDERVERINVLGCQLKDHDAGLVDFPGVVGGEVVNLCWQRGEPEVAWWHTLESGFAGRKPLP